MATIRSRYFFAALFALAAAALPVSAEAQARWRVTNDRFAYEEGYRQGIREGENDARRGDRFAYQDEREFRNADRGYHRRYGDRERYRESFRSGYANGYSDAYRRIADYGRNNGRYGGYGRNDDGRYRGNTSGRYGYYNPAFDNGVRDGYEKGQEDLRKNRSFDPLRHSWYRSGDRHYEREYGLRDEYKNIYRRGFQQGYEQGYRGGRYRW